MKLEKSKSKGLDFFALKWSGQVEFSLFFINNRKLFPESGMIFYFTIMSSAFFEKVASAENPLQYSMEVGFYGLGKIGTDDFSLRQCLCDD